MTEDMDVKQPPAPKPSVLSMIGGGIGTVVGIAFGRYAGFTLLFPLGFALMAGALLFKIVKERNKPMVFASSVQVGHALWMLLGIIILRELNLILIDVLILLPVAVCLAFWPSAIVVGVLTCYQLASLVVNANDFAKMAIHTPEYKAILVHMVLRIVAVVLMVVGLIAIRKQKENTTATKTVEAAVEGSP